MAWGSCHDFEFKDLSVDFFQAKTHERQWALGSGLQSCKVGLGFGNGPSTSSPFPWCMLPRDPSG